MTALAPGAQNLTRTGRNISLAGVILSDPRQRGMRQTESGHENSRIAKNRAGGLPPSLEILKLRGEQSLRWGWGVKGRTQQRLRSEDKKILFTF